MDINSLKRHITISSYQDVSNLCGPLAGIGIDLFSYVRKFKNGARINLSNRPDWLLHYYENNFHSIGSFDGPYDIYTNGYTLWTTASSQRILKDAKSCFGIHQGLTIVKRHSQFTDFFYFATKLDNGTLTNFHLNNVDLFDRFILYFQDQGADLIKKAQTTKLILPNRPAEDVREELKNSALLLNDDVEMAYRQKFIEDTHIKHYHGYVGGRAVTITAHEMESLKLFLLKGMNSAEIADHLYRSQRTIETHLYNAKMKFGCHTKSELVEKLTAANLLDIT
jgi:DNA-binding CsgD family transcriptional regulator